MKWLLLLFLFPSTICVAQNDSLNFTDENGRKQGHWIVYGKDRPDLKYPPNGKIEEGDYKNDRKEGLWVKYYQDGINPKLAGIYSNNRPQGPYTKFYNNGVIKERGDFTAGKYIDTIFRYNRDGSLRLCIINSDEGRSILDSTLIYAENNCLDSIEVFDFEKDSLIVYKYDTLHCNRLIARKSSQLSRVTHCIWERNQPGEVTYADAQEDGDLKIKPLNPNIASKIPDAMRPVYRMDSTSIEVGKYRLLELHPDSLLNRSLFVQLRDKQWRGDGEYRFYNENDEIFIHGSFLNYQLWKGKVYIYDRDGILLRILIYSDGTFQEFGEL